MYSRILDKLVSRAKDVYLHEDDKVVFISDCHRGDGSYKDPLMQNLTIYKGALKYYLKSNFKLVEIGDGDDLWRNKDYRYIGYYYQDIYELLLEFKKKNSLYLFFGNHDIVKKYKKKFIKIINKSKGERFYKILKNLYEDLDFYEVAKFNRKDQEIFVFHGHQVDIMNSSFWRLSRFLVRNIWTPIESIGIKVPTSPSVNLNKAMNVDKVLLEWSKRNNKKIIAGHTHRSRLGSIDRGEYYNDGCCIYPNEITTIEYINGELKLIQWYLDIGEDDKIILTRKEIIY